MKEIILPRLGEDIKEATLTRWLKKEGDAVKKDEPVAEIATDKVDSELVAEADGYLSDRRFNEKDIVPVGAVVAILLEKKEEPKIAPELDAPQEETAHSTTPSVEENLLNPTDITPSDESDDAVKTMPVEDYLHKEEKVDERPELTEDRNKSYSPLVKKMIKQHNLSDKELNRIYAESVTNRITKNDINTYLENRPKHSTLHTNENTPSLSHESAIKIAPFIGDGDDDNNIEPMGRVRQLVADHMMHSIRTSAHATSFAEADVTPLVEWKKQHAPIALSSYDTKLTYTPLFIQSVLHSLKKYPALNSAITPNNEILYHKNINIGLATALPNGNLIVPVIKDALHYNILGMAQACQRVAKAARSNKLKPEDIKGSTFTISNIGMFGTLTGTPIINQPEVAILAIGAIKKRSHVIETIAGDSIAIRSILYLSLSYDHRIIDGALGGMFLNEIVQQLEQFDPQTKLV